jgi:hypothetical protein
VPEAITKSTLKQYRHSSAVTDLAELDRATVSPSTPGGVRWPDECLDWLSNPGR